MHDQVWRYPYGTSMVLQTDKVSNSLAPGYLNNATVTATIFDAVTGIAVPGQTWPLTLIYVTGSDGRYRATVNYNIDIVPGQRLVIEFLAINGALQRPWRKPAVVVRLE